MNFLQETLVVLKENGKEWKDVKWVGTREKRISKREFVRWANFEYGGEIGIDVLVVGNNWWLERCEYDGSEWWEFKKLPKMPMLVDEKIIKNKYGSYYLGKPIPLTEDEELENKLRYG